MSGPGQPIEKQAANAAQTRDGNPPNEPTQKELEAARRKLEEMSASPIDHYANEAAMLASDQIGPPVIEQVSGPPEPTAYAELTKALLAFTRAQKAFIHTKDLANLMWAQINYMTAIAEYLSTVDLPMIVGQQEDYIEHLHTLMEQKEII
jgi:hypothetical protein